MRLSLKESRGAVPDVEKTEVEQLSQMATSDVLEVADPSWRASTVLQQKLTEVVDTQTQVIGSAVNFLLLLVHSLYKLGQWLRIISSW